MLRSGDRSLSVRRSGRRLLAALVGATLLVAALVVVVRSRDDEPTCGAERVAAPSSPLVTGAELRADPKLDRLVGAVDAMGAPFGGVRAGVGFNYDQFLQLYAVAGGVLTWTRNSSPVTMLDQDSLAPRWSLRPTSKRTAWDASAENFVLLDLDDKVPTTIASYRLGDGSQAWCTSLGDVQHDGDPVATAFLDDGDLLTALPGGTGIAISNLDGSSGNRRWRQVMTGVDRADFLGPLGDGVALAGGTEEFRLGEAITSAPAVSLTAFRVADGSPVWTWGPGSTERAHVVGVDDGRVIVELGTAAGTELVALDADDGSVLWHVDLNGQQAALRGSMVLVKATAGLVGYDAATGAVRWRIPVPTDRTYFPYGFTLGQMPSLDADHVLVPTTEALRILDVRTGKVVSYPLPLDGVSTTYWPYQLMVSEKLIGVVTNTGGVVADRSN